MSGQIGRFGFPFTIAFYELSRILFIQCWLIFLIKPWMSKFTPRTVVHENNQFYETILIRHIFLPFLLFMKQQKIIPYIFKSQKVTTAFSIYLSNVVSYEKTTPPSSQYGGNFFAPKFYGIRCKNIQKTLNFLYLS